MNDSDIRHVGDTDPNAARLHREYAHRIGMLTLYWAGFETGHATDDALDPSKLEHLETFIEALGASSVPEACATVAAGVFAHAR